MSAYFDGIGLALRPKGVAVSNLRCGFVDTKMASGKYVIGSTATPIELRLCVAVSTADATVAVFERMLRALLSTEATRSTA
jgi:hypothetical protein